MKALLSLVAVVMLAASCQHGGRNEPPAAQAAALEPNAPCTDDSQCGDGHVCEGCSEGDRTCIPGCRTDTDCTGGESCRQVQCIRCPCPPLCSGE